MSLSNILVPNNDTLYCGNIILTNTYTINQLWSGPWNGAIAGNIIVSNINNTVTLTISGINTTTQNGNTSLISSTINLNPTERPLIPIYAIANVFINNLGNYYPVCLELGTDGSIQINGSLTPSTTIIGDGGQLIFLTMSMSYSTLIS